jgi:hypothetical protein
MTDTAHVLQDEPAPHDDPSTDDDFKNVVKALVRRARSFADYEIIPAVAKARRYRAGQVDFDPANLVPDVRRPDGSQVYEGSSVVMTEVEDTIDQLLPELARVFLGSDEPVHFDPQSEGDEEAAKQATDYCTYVWTVENDGEAKTLDLFDEWLTKFCALKVWWESDESTESSRFSGWSDEQVQMVEAAAHAGYDGIVAFEAEPSVVALPVHQPTPDGGALWSVAQAREWAGTVTRRKSAGRICVDLVPHEEFIIDGDASEVDKARFVGQDTWKLVSEVVALGVPLETARRYKGSSPGGRGGGQGRWQRGGGNPSPSLVGDDSLDWCRVVEGVVMHDRDGDGIAERYRVLALGDNVEVVAAFEDDSVGFVVDSPYRQPFRPIGKGVPERTFDLQDLSTTVTRSILDNFRRSINPREICADDDQAYQDLTSWFPGVIRANRPDAISIHQIPFVGGGTLPLLDLVAQRLATRTGISSAGAGLDANALKGQTLEASHEILTAPQSRTEFLVRRFAIGVMRPLFREILRLSVKYQDREKTIRLRDKWVTVDPRSWNAAMDVRPRVGLGTGTRAERMVGLNLIAQKQEMMVFNPAYGPNGPLVDLALLRNTYVAMAELAGEKEAGRYFKEMDEQALAAFAQQQAQGAQQAQQQAIQTQLTLEQGKAQAKAQGQAAAAQAGAQARAQGHVAATQGQAQIKGNADVQKAMLLAQVQQQTDEHKARIAADLQQQQAHVDLATATQKLAMEERLKRLELAMEYQLEQAKMANRARSGQGNIPAVVE